MWLLLACTDPDAPDEPADSADSTATTDTTDTTDDSGTTDTGTRPRGPALVFEQPPTNLLVVSIDTLRRRSLGRYGAGITSPFLDGLAADGVVLDDHMTCSNWTLPGVLCTLAGRQFGDLGVVPRHTDGLSTGGLPDGAKVLSMWLSDAGYSTGLVSTNVNLSASFFGSAYEYEQLLSGEPALEIVDAALQQIDDQRAEGRPWMTHAHFMDVHGPYDPPEAYLGLLDGRPPLLWDLSTGEGTFALAQAWETLDEATRLEAMTQLTIRYEAQITYLDAELRRFWDELEAAGALDDTLVLVWSDHGEQLLEHGSIGHQGTLFAPESDGVAFWWAHGLAPVAWAEPTSSIDLAITTLDALGLPIPEEVRGDVVGTADPTRPRYGMFWPGAQPPLVLAQVGPDQLMYRFSGGVQLYRRDIDPDQLNDAYDPDDPDVLALWDALDPYVTQIADLTGETPLPPE
jgi:arylsulfatase A-like enzyme